MVLQTGNNTNPRSNSPVLPWVSLGIKTTREDKTRGGIQIGNKSHLGARDSIAIGIHSQTTGTGSIAIGSTGLDGYATKAGRDSIALGFNTDASEAWQGIALGSGVEVKGNRNIVLGSSSHWKTQMSVAGIGNIAIGATNTIESGAANLKKVKEKGRDVTSSHAKGTAEYEFKDGSENNVVLGSSNTIRSGSSDNTILGSKNELKANAQNIVVLGSNIKADANNAIYIGSGSTANTKAEETTVNHVTTSTAGEEAHHGTRIDGQWVEYAGTGASGNGVVTVGSVGKERRIQNVAAGLIAPNSTDAVNGSQLYTVTKANMLWVYTDTDGKEVFQAKDGKWYYRYNKKDGTEVTFKATGEPEENASEVTPGTEIVASIKHNAPATGTNSTTTPMKLSNVDAGVRDTDAVNVSQLKVISNDIQNINNNIQNINNNIQNINNDIKNINNRITNLSKKMDGIAAGSAAMANLPQSYVPGKSIVAVAMGSYKSQQAVAVGVSRISDNGKVILKLSTSHNTSGNMAFGAGVGYQF
ncbi:YadA family autotransporter adhesin [Gallibacterium salpingitidis]|uniref:YadA family autotransporter adhesin n=1 Tax=Gallibacterium salpingitidis TaxID=505341 RepID=UPI000826C137|nr:YadA-like family protein [Gallibacterium salpingitidis]